MKLANHFVFVLAMDVVAVAQALRDSSQADFASALGPASSGVEKVPASKRQLAARDRIISCADMTKWSGLKRAFAISGNGSLGLFIADQVSLRISTQGRVIEQGIEGLCGPISLEYLMVLLRPDDFAESVADLFCDGETSRLGASSPRRLVASKEVLDCAQSARDTEKLFGFQEEGLVHAVDWIWSASLASESNLMTSVCRSRSGQGQSPSDMVAMTKYVFPEASRSLTGGVQRHIWRNLVPARSSGKKGYRTRHVSKDEWETALDKVRTGGQALLTVVGGMVDGRHNGKVLRTRTSHWVVLTQVIDSSFAGGSGQKSTCARRLLSETKACVVWTYAKYMLYESCDNLRKGVADIISIDFPGHEGTPGPRAFLPGGQWNREALIQLIKLHIERRQGLVGLWVGSKVVANQDIGAFAGDQDYQVSRGRSGEIRWRGTMKGQGDVIDIRWDGDEKDREMFRSEFHKLSVTQIAAGVTEREFGNNDLSIVGRRLMGKQKDAGWPNEDYDECPID